MGARGVVQHALQGAHMGDRGAGADLGSLVSKQLQGQVREYVEVPALVSCFGSPSQRSVSKALGSQGNVNRNSWRRTATTAE